jgi:hypothetical protein
MDRRLAPFANEAADKFSGLPFLRGAIDRLARQATEKDAQWSLVCHRAGSCKDRVEQHDDPGGKPHQCKCKEKLVTFDFGGELGDLFLVFRVHRKSFHLIAVSFHFGLLMKAGPKQVDEKGRIVSCDFAPISCEGVPAHRSSQSRSI